MMQCKVSRVVLYGELFRYSFSSLSFLSHSLRVDFLSHCSSLLLFPFLPSCATPSALLTPLITTAAVTPTVLPLVVAILGFLGCYYIPRLVLMPSSTNTSLLLRPSVVLISAASSPAAAAVAARPSLPSVCQVFPRFPKNVTAAPPPGDRLPRAHHVVRIDRPELCVAANAAFSLDFLFWRKLRLED